MWATDADGMAASLRQHDEIFRARTTEHDGYVFSTAGDSFAIAFERASQAALCTSAILDDLASVDWGGRPSLSVRHVAVARRPLLAADLCTLFALIELRHGQPELATSAAELGTASVGPLGIDLLVERTGLVKCSPAERMRVWEDEMRRVDLEQRFQNNALLAPTLLADAIARWS